ncbi:MULTISPECIES: ABC transporter ATP-binding protein [unclassified Aeromicrobium]|uniref:ABC transporter ATP-binding protein n=1 Tax=unclassified Aeromicrobium TaxID=2633570 RepID=UPI00396B2905
MDPAPAQDPPVVTAADLRMSYGEKEVLKGLDFEVRRGEVVALLGPNGAGKTTTIEILEGFRKPSDGDVRVLDAVPLTADEAWRSRVGVVLQSWRDHGRWKVRELLEQFGSYYAPYATPGRERPYDTDDLLDRVGLTPQADAKVKSLSGGQRRRLDVAIGIVGRPEVLFLDEPTVGFDPVARRDFHALVDRLSDLEDTTILLTTHDLNEAEKLADRILILNHGRIVADGSAASLAEQISGTTEVRWTQHGTPHTQTTADGTAFVRELLARHPDGIADLEVRRSTLEDTYLAMVARHEESDEQQEVPA